MTDNRTTVKIGEVVPFANVSPDKALALKPIEEAAEVFGAWQRWKPNDTMFEYYKARSWAFCPEYRALLDECADVIQATCNLLAALGVDDFTAGMERCRERNEARGRYV